MILKKVKIFYWANSELKNDGEGILANNFLFLLKNNFKNSSLISINKIKLKNKQSIFAKYILPFYGVILLWGHYLKNEKISYINYLPAWNFLLIFLLPPRTIIGPVTGSINRKNWNFFVTVFSYIGIKSVIGITCVMSGFESLYHIPYLLEQMGQKALQAGYCAILAITSASLTACSALLGFLSTRCKMPRKVINNKLVLSEYL